MGIRVNHPTPDSRNAWRLAKAITKHFSKVVEVYVGEMMSDGRLTPENINASDGGTLLELRKRLVTAVKKGMLERQDMETEIAVLAALVWFQRQEAEKQARIAEWGV